METGAALTPRTPDPFPIAELPGIWPRSHSLPSPMLSIWGHICVSKFPHMLRENQTKVCELHIKLFLTSWCSVLQSVHSISFPKVLSLFLSPTVSDVFWDQLGLCLFFFFLTLYINLWFVFLFLFPSSLSQARLGWTGLRSGLEEKRLFFLWQPLCLNASPTLRLSSSPKPTNQSSPWPGTSS